MFLQQLILAFLICGSYSDDPYPYNSFTYNKHPDSWKEAPRYPDTCCQLMWQDISLNDELPADYVLAGNFLGRNFAFARQSALSFPKSDMPGEPPNWLGANSLGKNVDEYHILVNPNKCELGWYKTRFFEERLPVNSEDRVFPSLGSSKWGDYVQYKNIPGFCSQNYGGFKKMTSMTDSEWIEVKGLGLLYVDCKASIPKMSYAKLLSITYDEDVYAQLKQQPQKVVYHKKMLLNNSPLPSKSNVEFQVETMDNASMILTDSYSNAFEIGSETYNDYLAKNNVLENFGITLSAGVETDKSTSGSKKIFSSEKKLFKFEQEIQIPQFSRVIVTAFSKPVKGQIPFTAIYELTPKNLLTIEVLEKTIAKYNPGEKMKRVGDKLHMTYDGFIEIDSGHEVDVDIQTVPLPGHS